MNIRYEYSTQLAKSDFIDLLRRSTLAERRPVDDLEIVKAMIDHANLLCTAWDGDTLVGLARSLTDFQYCCYLSDLAVDAACQRTGIGRELIHQTQLKLGPHAKIILLSAPNAEEYYPRLGFEPHHSAWILPASKLLR